MNMSQKPSQGGAEPTVKVYRLVGCLDDWLVVWMVGQLVG